MPRIRFSLTLFALAVLPLAFLRGQTVRWQPSGGTLAFGQTTELSLIFEDCEPTGDIVLPVVPAINFGRASRGEQSSFSVVNGKAARTRTVYFTYPARPNLKSPVTIPSFTVATDQGNVTVPAASFDVVDATVGRGAVPLDDAANSQLRAGGGTAWAGEVLPVEYTLSISTRFPAQLATNPDWASTPLVVEEWSKPEPFSAVVADETRQNILYRSRGYIREPGTYTLNAVNQLVNLRVPSSNFSVFQAFQAEQFSITSNRPAIVVRPLPQPAPAGFDGAVGQFNLVSRVVPETASVSEPVTWTLELSGTGNWPDLTGLPGREVSRDFRVVQPQARRDTANGALFEASLSEDVVLIPTKPGTYTLGPVVWSYFDPATGTYKTLTTERVTVTVTAPTADPLAPASPGGAAASSPAATPAAPLQTPDDPDAIPRDPIPGSGFSPVPWNGFGVGWAVAASVAWLPLFWLALAWRRARLTDPVRPKREARIRLANTIEALKNAREPAGVRKLLRSWQRDVALLWPLAKAAPTARAFKQDAAWSSLWLEAERVLYGNGESLPADWTTRAEAALSTRSVPPFPAAAIFRRGNLLPFLAAVALALIVASRNHAAEVDPTAAYNGSQFSAAEKGWREALGRQPTDWVARHNLSLALGQQGRWSEAAAHAVAAFVQQPSDESVRWNLALALGRAGYAPPDIAEFSRPGRLHSLAQRFSPAGWQRVLVGSGFLAAVSAALVLLAAYGVRPRALLPPAAALLVAALVATGAAVTSLRLYGLATDSRAVIVWHQATLRSIPTEADTAQTTTGLGAGSLAVIDHSFLGWIRLAFPNGQTGWVRQEDVVRLYR